MSDRDRALEKATRAMYEAFDEQQRDWPAMTKACVAEWLDSLLEGLPEEAVEEVTKAIAFDGDPEDAARAFLRSLRTGLEGSTE